MSSRASIETWDADVWDPDVRSQVLLELDIPFPTQLPPYLSVFKFLTAGAASGVVSKTVTAPFERLKLLQQTAAGPESTLSLLRHLLSSAGVAALFRGNGANIVQIVPFASIVTLVYSSACGLEASLRPRILTAHSPTSSSPTSSSSTGLDPRPPQPLLAWRAASGAAAGLIATLVTYPLDTIRGNLSIQVSPTESRVYDRGILDSARRIVASDGLVGLYRGLAPSLVTIAPFMALQMSVYDGLKLVSPTRVPFLSAHADATTFHLACGVVAGVTARTLTYPIDLIRRRMQLINVTDFNYRSSANAFVTILKTDGVRGLFRGATPAALKVAPAVASGLVVRDSVLAWLTHPDTDPDG